MRAKTISILATAVLIAAVVVLGVRGGILGVGPVSISLQIAGVLVVVWARLTFGIRSFHFAANPTQGALITTGPYRFVRNPIYASAWLVIWAGIAVHWSVVNALLGLLVAATLLVKIVCEEQLLGAAYPEYQDYARRTARVVPFLL